MSNGDIISKETLIPIGLAVAICGAIITGVLWSNSKLISIQYELKDVRRSILNIETSLEYAASDRWTGNQMYQWVELLQVKNPDLDIPEVRRRDGD